MTDRLFEKALTDLWSLTAVPHRCRHLCELPVQATTHPILGNQCLSLTHDSERPSAGTFGRSESRVRRFQIRDVVMGGGCHKFAAWKLFYT